MLLLTEQGLGETGNTMHLYLPTNYLTVEPVETYFTKPFLQRLQKILTRYLCQKCLL